MWAAQLGGLVLVICTTYSSPTANQTEAPGGYRIGWTVRDDKTRVYNTHHEEELGSGGGRGVRGEYTVGEPNGDLRVVSYSVAPGTGFQATVRVLPGGSPVGGPTVGSHPEGTSPENKGKDEEALIVKKEENIEQDTTLLEVHEGRQAQSESLNHFQTEQKSFTTQKMIVEIKPEYITEQPQSAKSKENDGANTTGQRDEILNDRKLNEGFSKEETLKYDQKDPQMLSVVKIAPKDVLVNSYEQEIKDGKKKEQEQMLKENKSDNTEVSEGNLKTKQKQFEVKGNVKMAADGVKESSTVPKIQEGEKKDQILKKVEKSFDREEPTTDLSQSPTTVDLLKDLAYVDKHIHDIEYIVEKEHEEELQSKQNDFVKSDFPHGNPLIVRVHEDEDDQNHDLLELASNSGDVVDQGSVEMDVGESLTTVSSPTSVQVMVNNAPEGGENPAPHAKPSSASTDNSQHLAEHSEFSTQSHAPEPTQHSDPTTYISNWMKNTDNSMKVDNEASSSLSSVILAALMIPTAPVIKLTCLPDESLSSGLQTEPIPQFGPTFNQYQPRFQSEQPKALVTTTFPILPLSMVNFGPPKINPVASLLSQGSKPQVGCIMNNFGSITTHAQPEPTNTQTGSTLIHSRPRPTSAAQMRSVSSSEHPQQTDSDQIALRTYHEQPQLTTATNTFFTIQEQPLISNPAQIGHQPTNIAQDTQMKTTRSYLHRDISPPIANGFYPGYLLPPPWVRAQHHHGPRHMPIFVLPMSHNANFAPTFNPEMFGKHNKK